MKNIEISAFKSTANAKSTAIKLITFGFWLLAACYLILAVTGAVTFYSPVPTYDMWDSHINFYLKFSLSNIGSLWDQHNEHRIFLSRVLFLIDHTFFRGIGIFLVVVNYILVAMCFVVFYFILNEKHIDKNNESIKTCTLLVIFCLTFSWTQYDNLIHPFQSQFIMAQLLPIVSFLFLYKASNNLQKKYFFLACFSGLLSLGSMANGILALPMLTILAILYKMEKRQIIILLSLTIIGLSFYFHNYFSPRIHGSLFSTLTTDPLGVIQYTLLYLGNPFIFITSYRPFLVAQCAGLFLVCSTLFYCWLLVKNRDYNTIDIALLMFILYLFGSAFATAGSRLVFGMESALTSRYFTPTLMAWSTLIILYTPMITKLFNKQPFFSLIILSFFPLLLLNQQFKPVNFAHIYIGKNVNFERKIAALALNLGVHDRQQLEHIYPYFENIKKIGNRAVAEKISIFDFKEFIFTRENILKQHNIETTVSCKGNIEPIAAIEDDPAYKRIRGWIYEPSTKTVPKIILISDKNSRIVGFALSGEMLIHLENENVANYNYRGFKGYILAEQIDKPSTVYGLQPDCILKF